MNILLVTDDLFPGGISRHVVDLANGLSQEGHAVTVAAAEGSYREELLRSVHYVRLPLMKKNTQNKSLWGFVLSYAALVLLIAKNKYDIIHSHKRFVHFILSTIPKVGSRHITSYHTVFKGKHTLSRLGDFTVCCSDAVRSMIIDRYKRPVSITCTVYNGIAPLRQSNILERREILQKLSIEPTKRIVASIGQFVPSKDKETLLKAIGHLMEAGEIQNVLFILLGYGPLRDSLRMLAGTLGIQKHVLFLDESFPASQLISLSEFMILNSKHSEGFGIVLLEGASLGKAHIGTTVGGIPEFIEHRRTGLLIPPEDHRILAENIRYLLEHPDECVQMGTRAREKYECQFRVEHMLEAMIKVYEKVLVSKVQDNH